jgi:OmpA-OmpF porin, OOP family
VKMHRLIAHTSLCVLLSALTACSTPRDIPAQTAGKGGSADQFGELQTRLNQLQTKNATDAAGVATDTTATTEGKYAWAKAQCWLRNGYSELHENDANGFAVQSLSEAKKIIEGLEAGKALAQPTVLVNHSEPLRTDLWQRAAALKQHKGYACAAAQVACLEVQLSRAGHEMSSMGWRHANPYLAIAEDMTARAQTQAQACKS